MALAAVIAPAATTPSPIADAVPAITHFFLLSMSERSFRGRAVRSVILRLPIADETAGRCS